MHENVPMFADRFRSWGEDVKKTLYEGGFPVIGATTVTVVDTEDCDCEQSEHRCEHRCTVQIGDHSFVMDVVFDEYHTEIEFSDPSILRSNKLSGDYTYPVVARWIQLYY